ncbi:MAG: hypothetical protein IPH31_07305 [Lewinellaceae bacterium]|nr:hypothetical protein [Lewinellaceae bacterium]
MANFTSNSISVINPFTNTLETTIPVGTNPVRLMKGGGAGGQGSGGPNPPPNPTDPTSPQANRVYVINSNSNSISVIDANKVIATIPVGEGPNNIARNYNISPLSNRIYVSNEYSGDVTVINSLTYTVIETIPIGGANCIKRLCCRFKMFFRTRLGQWLVRRRKQPLAVQYLRQKRHPLK